MYFNLQDKTKKIQDINFVSYNFCQNLKKNMKQILS